MKAELVSCAPGGVYVELDKESFLELLEKLRPRGAILIHGSIGLVKKKNVYLLVHGCIVYAYVGEEPLEDVVPDIEAKTLVMPLTGRTA